ncbi:MAG TPA: hypothetical protein DIW46_00510 [Microbacterium sp.]|uniref:sensor histidine kinase n=1 Tax=Microbacterium sp. TaxID=51671 RepID=UPI000EBA33C9|nr:hypothetical protein [Microbacterium sp.]
MKREQVMASALAAAFTADDAAPQRLIQIVGETLRAQWCELTVATRRYEWSAPGRRIADRAHCSLSSDPEITIALAPASAMLTAQQWQPLLVLLEPLAFTEAAESAQRLRNDAVHRLDDARWHASVDMAQERRDLERHLHDGAQQHLVALQLAVAMADHQDGDSGGEQRRDSVRSKLDSAEQVLVATARGVLPHTLAAGGLNGALHSLTGPALSVRAELPRLMPAVESALYFIALEAVSNARKHAKGAQISIDARMRGGRVTVSIRDDGPGFIVDEDGIGGLSHLAHRLEAINGDVDVQSAPGEGTRVTASVRY